MQQIRPLALRAGFKFSGEGDDSRAEVVDSAVTMMQEMERELFARSSSLFVLGGATACACAMPAARRAASHNAAGCV